MDPAHYSRIESGKTDQSFSVVLRIAKALRVELSDLFRADEAFSPVESFDKSLVERVALIDTLDKKEKAALLSMVDALVQKKRLTDSLNAAFGKASV